MADAPPAFPSQFQIYNTYVLDPPYQIKFSIAWTAAVALFTVFSLYKFVYNARSGRTWQSARGISLRLNPTAQYHQVTEKLQSPPANPSSRRSASSPPLAFLSNLERRLLWSFPGFDLAFGQLLILAGYALLLIFCIVFRAPLHANPNRAGFLTLAQLPFVFLFATKNNVLSLFWQRGYEKLNFLHRWAGRGILLSATIHGALWMRNHIQYGLSIIELPKERFGLQTYIFLCLLFLTSLKPVRYYAYQFFFFMHIVCFVAFFVLLNYHTPYSTPWIYPPLAFYGFDLLVRLFRYRVREAILEAPDQQMTILRVQDCDEGWVAGQHVRLRTFFAGRLFESHPLTIVNAPPKSSCTPSQHVLLGARVKGDWTRALNRMARADKENMGIPLMVMMDGPYGGSSIDVACYENVLLVAGGSGITFTLALLDDLVGRTVRLGRPGGEKTRRVEFAWCIRSYGNIRWFASMLRDIATLANNSSVELHISVYVTCLCDPEAVPDIPNMQVIVEKPSVRKLLTPLIHHPENEEKTTQFVDGLAVAASGPASLIMEARNEIAKMSSFDHRRMGRIAIHTEVFTI